MTAGRHAQSPQNILESRFDRTSVRRRALKLTAAKDSA
jgi:hypothetical protein